ncbi:MAG: HAD family phosphatase [Bacteroidetes Order II. Incertae sedis bacterium]|nr:HAD family phosphatase [Bacteroidetes Order II. bacterium]
MSMTQALIFDMDGTIVDNMAVHIEVWLSLLARHGVTQTAEDFHHTSSGKTNPEILRYYLGPHLSDTSVSALGEEKELLYRTVYKDRLSAITGLYEILGEARGKGLRLALATSAPPVNVSFVLNGLHLKDTFDAIVTAEDVLLGKPNPEAFLTASKRLKCDPVHCVVFEDAPVGIQAAQRAGMRCVVVATSPVSPSDAAAPHVLQVVQDFTMVDRRLLDL